MSKNARVGASIILFLLAMCLRVAMSFFPSFPLCCLFWATIAAANILAAYYLWLPGLACNAAAMIANGGFMPVFGQKVTPGGEHIQGTPDAALQILCDQYWGFSIGDFLLLAALVLTTARSLILHHRAASSSALPDDRSATSEQTVVR